MKLILLFLSPLVLWCQSPPPVVVVGSVKIVRGDVSIHRGPQVIPAVEGAHLLAHDSLQTSAGGSLGVILQDGTRVSLGPNTSVEIDRFTYEPVEGRFALLLRLSRGVLAYISGKIAQFSPGSVQVETPVGIVGLRGTEFAISLEGS
jgi:hypothetical protein